MFQLPSSAHMVLDHLLAALDIGMTHFRLCDIRDGWGMRLDPSRTASLHYCLAGVGTLAVHGELPIQLEPHAFVLLPPGVAYGIDSASQKSARLERRARLHGVSSHESVPTLTVGEGQQGTSPLPLLPWLAGVADMRLSRALHAVFEQPAAAFTVEGLAMIAGMSRSAFAAAFRRVFLDGRGVRALPNVHDAGL